MGTTIFYRFVFLILLIQVCIAGCKETEDDQYPEISVLSPSAGTVFQNGDTIYFKAVCSDNTTMVSISLQLVDKDNKPALKTLFTSASTNPFTFEGSYILDDPQMRGDLYYLRFQCSDGINVTNQFTQIQILESNPELLYPIIVTQPEASSWNAYRLLADGKWRKFATHTGDYCGSAVNSAASQFYFCGKYQSDLQAVKMPDGAPAWNVKPGFSPHFRWFEGIVSEQTYVYTSCYEGNIRGYDNTGNEKYKSETFLSAYPHISVLTNNFVIGSFINDYNTNKYLIVFHNEGGKMIYNKFITENIVGLLHTTSDKVLLFSNKNQTGSISVYNGADNTLSPLKVIPEGTIFDVAEMSSDYYFISTSAGIFLYRYSKNSISTFTNKTINSPIACDPLEKQLYVGMNQHFDIYTYPSGELVLSLNTPETVIDLHLLFNK